VNYFLWNDFAAFTKGEKIFISHLLLIW
jgi:hypothetical protein